MSLRRAAFGLCALSLVLGASPAAAQQAAKLYRIGVNRCKRLFDEYGQAMLQSGPCKSDMCVIRCRDKDAVNLIEDGIQRG